MHLPCIDAAILHNAVGYENSAYESPTNISVKGGINTSLTKKEFQTLHKFDIRALLGITYNLSNSWHFGLKFTQAFSSYLKKELAPALSSDPAAGISDPLPTKSTNASFQFFTRYDFNILKKRNKKGEEINQNNISQQQPTALQSKQLDLVAKTKKWSIRPGFTFSIPLPIGTQVNTAVGATENQFLNYLVPSVHFNFRYQINPNMLGATYNITRNLHCGALFTQAFTSYLKNTAPIAPLYPSDPNPSNITNSSLQLFLKYDLDLLKKKKNKQCLK